MNIIKDLKRNTLTFSSLQALSFLIYPFLTNTISPGNLAEWFIWLNFLIIISSYSSLKYEDAIVIAKSDKEAKSLASLSLLISFIFSIFAGLIIGLALFFNSSQNNYNVLLYLIPTVFASFSFSINKIISCWLIRKSFYPLYTILNFAPPILCPIFQIIFFKVNKDPYFLFIAGSLGYVLPSLILVIYFISSNIKFPKIIEKNSINLLKKYYRFPLYSVPYLTLFLIRERLIFAFLALANNPTAIALFSLNYKLCNLIPSLIATPIRPVIFNFSSRIGLKSLKKLLHPAMESLSYFLYPLILITLIWAEDFLGIIFGTKWIGAAVYFKMGIISYSVLGLSSWLDKLFDSSFNQKVLFKTELFFSLLLIIGLSLIHQLNGNIFNMVFFVNVINFFYGWFFLWNIYKILKISNYYFFKFFLKFILIVSISFLTVQWFKVSMGNLLSIFITLTISLFSFYLGYIEYYRKIKIPFDIEIKK